MPAPDDFSREPEKPLFALLDRLGIRHDTITHAMVFTVAESAEREGRHAGRPHQEPLHEGQDGPAGPGLRAPCDQRCRSTSCTGRLGCQRLSFTDAPLLWDALGVTPGSVTGFAVMNDHGRAASAWSPTRRCWPTKRSISTRSAAT